MRERIDRLVGEFEGGRLTRRQLVLGLTALSAMGVAGRSRCEAAEGSTFQATGLNHIALRVTNVARSRDFYVEHLGLEVSSQNLPGSCFLDCGDEFVALFRGDQAGLDHYCYSIPDYDQQTAAETLRSIGLEPRLAGNRIYFPDPDGLTVQLAAPRIGD